PCIGIVADNLATAPYGQIVDRLAGLFTHDFLRPIDIRIQIGVATIPTQLDLSLTPTWLLPHLAEAFIHQARVFSTIDIRGHAEWLQYCRFRTERHFRPTNHTLLCRYDDYAICSTHPINSRRRRIFQYRERLDFMHIYVV